MWQENGRSEFSVLLRTPGGKSRRGKLIVFYELHIKIMLQDFNIMCEKYV